MPLDNISANRFFCLSQVFLQIHLCHKDYTILAKRQKKIKTTDIKYSFIIKRIYIYNVSSEYGKLDISLFFPFLGGTVSVLLDFINIFFAYFNKMNVYLFPYEFKFKSPVIKNKIIISHVWIRTPFRFLGLSSQIRSYSDLTDAIIQMMTRRVILFEINKKCFAC